MIKAQSRGRAMIAELGHFALILAFVAAIVQMIVHMKIVLQKIIRY